MSERTCEQCAWWVKLSDDEIRGMFELYLRTGEVGTCRFNPAIMIPRTEQERRFPPFPVTNRKDWCRQFALREDLAIEKQKERERQRIGIRAPTPKPTRAGGEW